MAKKTATVSVTALKAHTHDGQAHDEGDTYAVAPEAVENLVAIGFVRRTDPAPPLPTPTKVKDEDEDA